MPTNHSHLTAKERDKISFPTNYLLRKELIRGRVLDFGCGLGADVIGLQSKRFDVFGYDPYYQPVYPTLKFDTIICQYVFNVLELEHQERLLLEITSLLNKGGCAFITVRRDVRYEGFRTHKIHQKTTFQRNVVLNFESVLLNDFCEIYKVERKTDIRSKESCIFCRPSSKLKYIAESSNTLAVYDGFPVSKGHALVIPKKHVVDYFDLDKPTQNELWDTVAFVKEYIEQQFSPDGFNVGINVRQSAGQTIFHCHIHIIPRYQGDVDNPRGGVRRVIPTKGYYS